MTEPAQKPGKSKQDYQTPTEFLRAIAQQFGSIDLDLACRDDNSVAPQGITEQMDSLAQDWTELGVRVAFCNPPFADLEPWAAKLAACRWLPRWTLMLVPYSASSQWFVRPCQGQLMVYGIPRLTFRGTTAPYPKDLALIAAGFGANGATFWDWRRSLRQSENQSEGGC